MTTTESILVEREGAVAVLRMARAPANALEPGICRELTARLRELSDAGGGPVVLTGSGGIFSAGVDLVRLLEGGAAYVEDLLEALTEAFLALFAFPGPAVAAVNGHAIAGGAVLAAACDHRVMNAGHGRIGLPELAVGVPFMVGAVEILRCAYGTPRASELVLRGETHAAAEALARGLVDEAAEADAVLPRAVEVAALGDVPPEALAHTKGLLRAPYLEAIARRRADDARRVAELWTSPATLAAVDAYVERTLRRR